MRSSEGPYTLSMLRRVKKLILGLVFAAIAAGVIIIGSRLAMGTLMDNLSHQSQSPAHSVTPRSTPLDRGSQACNGSACSVRESTLFPHLSAPLHHIEPTFVGSTRCPADA